MTDFKQDPSRQATDTAGRRRLLGTGAAMAALLVTGCGTGALGRRSPERAEAPSPARTAADGGSPVAAVADASAGSSPIELIDADWLDTRRDRAVPIRLFLPVLPGKAPLVIFSHGLGGSRNGYNHLGRYWASQGIATLHTQHAGSDRAVWGAGGLAVLGALKAAATPEQAIARTLDVRFALDRALSHPPWADRLDARRVGVAGHSFGANTALLSCGARYREAGGRIATFGDPRIRAAVVLSAPALPNDQDPLFAYGAIGVPSLHLTGTQDATPIPGLTTLPQERRVPFDSIAAGPRYLGIFEGGRHSMFNDWSRDETSQAIKSETRVLTLAFWRSVFEQDPAATLLLRAPAGRRPALNALLTTWEARV